MLCYEDACSGMLSPSIEGNTISRLHWILFQNADLIVIFNRKAIRNRKKSRLLIECFFKLWHYHKFSEEAKEQKGHVRNKKKLLNGHWCKIITILSPSLYNRIIPHRHPDPKKCKHIYIYIFIKALTQEYICRKKKSDLDEQGNSIRFSFCVTTKRWRFVDKNVQHKIFFSHHCLMRCIRRR